MEVLVKRNVYYQSGVYLKKATSPQTVPDILFEDCNASPDSVVQILKEPAKAKKPAAPKD